MAELDIIKSPIDSKSYRYIELDNKLKVVLVSDPDADKAAASLDVNIGNGSDPDGWGGLAHFLEHMLFLGTKKYPNADEYQSFIKANGGSNNAYTSFDHTNYYFSITPEFFEPALDRFSRFFIDPTFDALYVDRERSVVHSEYQARKKDEGRRLWDAQKLFLNPDHPASRFSVGSIETLADRGSSTVREKLIEFYGNNYSASVMTLAVLGSQSLDELEVWVREKFSEIPNNGVSAARFEQPYFNSEIMPLRLDTIPEKDINALSFVFPVPSTYAEFQSKPFNYISNLLGHEGAGSLLALLKTNGWAETLSAGPGYTDRVQGAFNVRVGLTEEGVNHISEIGELLFAEIDLIRNKGVEKWRFEEQQKLAEISFRFAQERDPGRVVQSLSSKMHIYPQADILRGPYVMEDYKPDRIQELLGYLKPDNVNIQVTSRRLKANKKTQYYDVSYELSEIRKSTIEKWKNAKAGRDLKLPEVNPFIPERLDLLPLQGKDVMPQRTRDVSGIDLWYLQDEEFGTPRANFYFNIMSPIVNRSARNLVLTELYVRMVNYQLNDIVYPAYLADVNYSLYRHGRGLSVRMSGFEDKQSELLELVVEAMARPEFDPVVFKIVRAALTRELKNASKDSPSNQTVHEIYRLIMDPYWDENERLMALENIALPDLETFVPKFFKDVDVVALSHGDITLEKSQQRISVMGKLLADSALIDDVPRQGARILKRDQSYLRTLKIDHTDSALSAYFQGKSNGIEERIRITLLKGLLESPFYNNLRTVNRVGYLVHAGTIEIDRLPGLLFSVQSPSHSPDEINYLYEAFIEAFQEQLADMPREQFRAIQNGIVDRVLRAPKNLGDRSSRIWREIDLGELNFDSRERFADGLSRLTLEDMQAYFSELLENDPARLLVQASGSANGETGMLELSDAIDTGDVSEFRKASGGN